MSKGKPKKSTYCKPCPLYNYWVEEGRKEGRKYFKRAVQFCEKLKNEGECGKSN